jgi:hypothetical protein
MDYKWSIWHYLSIEDTKSFAGTRWCEELQLHSNLAQGGGTRVLTTPMSVIIINIMRKFNE